MAIPRLGLQLATRVRRGPATGADAWVGFDKAIPSDVLTPGIQVAVQGVPTRIRMALPEGLLSSDSIYLVSRVELRCASTEDEVLSDYIVLDDGRTYEVVHTIHSPRFLIETESWACTCNRIQSYQPLSVPLPPPGP